MTETFTSVTTEDPQLNTDQNLNTEPSNNQPFLQVGDRTFSNQDAVVNKIVNADNHIKTLEQERLQDQQRLVEALNKIDELKQQTQSNSKVDEILERLNQVGNDSNNNSESSTIDKAQLVQEVLGELNVKSQQEIAQQNIDQAMTLARQKFGDRLGEEITSKAKQLGMSLEAVDQLAAQTPDAFKELFIGELPSKQSSSDSNINTSVLDTQYKKDERNMPKPAFLKMTSKQRSDYIKAQMEAME